MRHPVTIFVTDTDYAKVVLTSYRWRFSMSDKPLHPWIRQPLVDLIVWAWPAMPARLKAWAFLNDGPLKDDRR